MCSYIFIIDPDSLFKRLDSQVYPEILNIDTSKIIPDNRIIRMVLDCLSIIFCCLFKRARLLVNLS